MKKVGADIGAGQAAEGLRDVVGPRERESPREGRPREGRPREGQRQREGKSGEY